MSKLLHLPFLLLASASLGCALSAGENSRLVEELQRAQLRALEGQLRVAELERRLEALEHAPRAESSQPQELGKLVDKLDLLIAQNQLLLAQRAELVSPAGTEPSEPAPASPADGGVDADTDADPREQLRYWVERVRNDSTRWRGGLSTEQSEALNVLSRPRALDPANPWRAR